MSHHSLNLLWLLLVPGCDQLWGGLSRNHPDNCVQAPAICSAEQRCNSMTELCEPKTGEVPMDMGMGAGDDPVLSSILPGLAPSSGGTALTLTGDRFAQGATVTIGGVGAAAGAGIMPMSIQVTAPFKQGACGLVPVKVSNPDGKSVTRSDLFGYTLSTVAFSAQEQSTGALRVIKCVAADMNGDGKLDLVSVSVGMAGVSVLPGAGDGTLGNPMSKDSAAEMRALTVADINGDGKLDVATLAPDGNLVSVRLGDGMGLSNVSLGTTVAAGARHFALADVNKDQKLDLLVATTVGVDSSLSVHLGVGNGNFLAAAPPYPLGAGCDARFVLAGDLLGNADPDVAVACKDLSVGISILVNLGNGTFGNARFFPISNVYPVSLAAADFNGDGKLDLAVADKVGGNVKVLVRNGEFSLMPLTLNLTAITGAQEEDHQVAVVDLNCDRLPDLAYTITAGANGVGVLLNQGGGTFANSMVFPINFPPIGLATGDFNGDGRPDLVVNSTSTDKVTVLRNTGD